MDKPTYYELGPEDHIYNGDWCAADGVFQKIDWFDKEEDGFYYAKPDGNVYFREIVK